MSAVLFSYPTLDAEPSLTVNAVKLDGVARPALLKREESAVNVYETDRSWKRLELDLELTCDAERLRAYESDHGKVGAVVVANCLPTNTRQPLRLTRSDVDVGRWSGVLELDRGNIRDRVNLTTTLTATVGEVPYRPIAAAPWWIAYADEPESLRKKGSLLVRWVNFTLPDAPLPAREFPKSTHVVVFGDGVPQLWLNSGFDGLPLLLNDRKDRRGADKALHDFQRTGIARAVWLVLVADALAAVQKGEEGAEPDWPDIPWQSEVLKIILPKVAPEKPESEWLRMATEEWRTHPGAADFFSRTEAAIGDIVKANEMVRRFAKAAPTEGVE